jgi:hypothetical protein
MTSTFSLVIISHQTKDLLISALFAAGVSIDAPVGMPLVELLCDRLGVSCDYLDHQVQTIFVNGRTVDRPEEVKITKDTTVALSAAMPGLMGATLRKGGLLAVFRKDISQLDMQAPDDSHRHTMVTLKLFNLVAKDIGPMLLQQGVWLRGDALGEHFGQIDRSRIAALEEVVWNGRPIPADQLYDIDWPKDWVRLVVLPAKNH